MADSFETEQEVGRPTSESDSALLEKILDSTRINLLDLGKRNRLINCPKPRSRGIAIEVVDELSEEVFRILAREHRSMTFLPGREARADDESDGGDVVGVYVPPEETEGDGLAERHIDKRLQTRLTPKGLQRRLLSIYRDARTLEEEQGVNILFLALGFLHWSESDTSDIDRLAPLVLLPVTLSRHDVRGHFTLSARDEDLSVNLSLQQMLKTDFNITLPDIPDNDDFSLATYFAEVTKAVSGKPRWRVEANEIILGFFSFTKLLMFRDLDPENWSDKAILKNPIINNLLGDGFGSEPSVFPEGKSLDEVLDPAELVHIMDADGSQTIVIEDVKRGRNIVVQGPPGTGKSQTIANVVAAAVHAGKKVLFVAEKMAALDVVYRRLERAGLGDLCLELHSRKASKKEVLGELERTLNAGRAMTPDDRSIRRLKEVRDKLNANVALLHTIHEPSGITPFEAIGEQVALKQKGLTVPEFTLPNAASWTRDKADEVFAAVANLSRLVAEAGPRDTHPWRGARVYAITPADRDRLAPRISETTSAVKSLQSLVGETQSVLAQPLQVSLGSVSDLIGDLELLSQRPEASAELFSNLLRPDLADRLKSLVKTGITYQTIRDQLANSVADAAWDAELGSARIHLASRGKSVFRFLNSDYRKASAFLKGLLTTEVPKSLDTKLELLDAIIAGQKARQQIRDETTLGGQIFGTSWQGEKSEFGPFQQIFDWLDKAIEDSSFDLVSAAVANVDRQSAISAANKLRENEATPKALFGALCETLAIDAKEAFGAADILQAPIDEIASRLEVWGQSLERLDQWSRLSYADEQVHELGASEIAERLANGMIDEKEAEPLIRFARYEAVWNAIIEQEPALRMFDGVQADKLVEEFCDLEHQRFTIAAQEIAALHSANMPAGGSGEMGVIRREIAKKRRHLPIRRLIEQAGTALQQIKPVFLMSPLSVAQYLPPGRIEFDLLLFDEASQVKPEDALGSIARCKQIVVVGDSKQLPPTSFFDRLTTDGEEDDEDDMAIRTGDMESILSLCEARGMSNETLRWHYRSRHPSLIEVSNYEFYDHRLFLPPSPHPSGSTFGLSVHHVNGIYDRGGSRTNVIEADALTDAIIEHARMHPDLSLGVAALSVQQRDAISNQLEFKRAMHPELEGFFSESREEPFFVKNLENVQGDERDAIFISIGYGPSEGSAGLVSMGFGPVSAEGGERRLNVLFTRAREKCAVFTSITSDQIDPNRAKHRGPLVLKRYLKFAESGIMDIPEITGRGFDSPFEESVADVIRRLGYPVETQVGSAGFFVDLGVKDPDNPGDFILGVECDGAAYHSARWARERDRLRQEILESQGWQIYRIWSSDWFYRPEEQEAKLNEALFKARETARKKRSSSDEQSSPVLFSNSDDTDTSETEQTQQPSSASSRTIIERELPATTHSESSSTRPYKEASFHIRYDLDPHELTAEQLATIVRTILDVEGPIHEEEVGRRVTQLWGYSRAGGRIQSATLTALQYLKKTNQALVSKKFWRLVDQPERPEPRSRTTVNSATLRRPEIIPPGEFEAGVLAVIREHVGINADELAQELGRLLGYKSTSAQLKSEITKALRRVVNTEEVSERGSNYYINST